MASMGMLHYIGKSMLSQFSNTKSTIQLVIHGESLPAALKTSHETLLHYITLFPLVNRQDYPIFEGMKNINLFVLVAFLITVILAFFYINYKTGQDVIFTCLIVGVSLFFPWFLRKLFRNKEE